MSRIGGIYALENILNSSREYHLSILEALAAFVREKSASVVTGDVQAAMTVIGRRKIVVNDAPDLHGASLVKTQLHLADLSGANLEGVNFEAANMSFANAGRAHLESANFRGADMTNLDLTGAHLKGANFEGAKMKGAVLRWVDLTDTNIAQNQLSEACGEHTTLATELSIRECESDDLPDYSLDPADRD